MFDGHFSALGPVMSLCIANNSLKTEVSLTKSEYPTNHYSNRPKYIESSSSLWLYPPQSWAFDKVYNIGE